MPPLKELPTRPDPVRPSKLNRRQALGLLATGMASGLAACSKPDEQILPYVRMPERIVPGEALKFATTLGLAGIGRGVIVTSVDGRPIKVEGNPRHPGSLGATDVFAEAAVLSLYDPDRSRTILHKGAIASREALLGVLTSELTEARSRQGDGLRLLTCRTTSPTLLRQIDGLLQAFPTAAWHAYDPTDDENARQGAQLAFGQAVCSLADFAQARMIVALDADPLGHGPDQIRIGRGFAMRRNDANAFSRLYCLESALSLTGAKADERLALRPEAIEQFAASLARELGAPIGAPELPERERLLLRNILLDLNAHKSEALVVAGPGMSKEVHAIAHWINAQLNAPVRLIDPIDHTPSGRQAGTLQQLADDLEGGRVRQLFIIGANPGYDAPVDLQFEARAQKAQFRLHMGEYVDETAALATWHVPQNHQLEAWSDLRASDGTASIVQPLIKPLYSSFGIHEVLAWMAGEQDASSYELVRQTWRDAAPEDFEAWWQRVLQEGVIPGTGAPAVKPAVSVSPSSTGAEAQEKKNGLSLVLRPDPCMWDGSFANNAWLQECPKPLSKQVWGNALALHPKDASRLGIQSGELVAIAAVGRSIEVPVLIEPGSAIGVCALTFGGGRQKAGAIGNGVGANAYALRTSDNPWRLAQVSITRTGRREPILTTQNIVRTPEDVRQLYPSYQLGRALPSTTPPDQPSLMPRPPKTDDGHAWAMVIDTSVCIGCNACVVSCQAENNVPVVGPEQVAMGRDMHWMRVDVYDHGATDDPQLGFQPVPCMHCEHAPCEPVCPVAASVHDHEGLNAQVYNRCIGTRFCEANCPYKVRRFNFFGYADGEEYGNLGADSYRGQKNPEVTVRARGVMEKCTYCVQRISAARRAAERENRAIDPDEVRTACQNACPTRAISFGDMNQPEAEVNTRKADPRHYALLGHLGTRPRTTYLADVRNPAGPDAEERT
ncbi:4Fe-4S dicluster domain-containing protein [Bradyrhizobium guangdongense]|uniref:4Fe-4S ferredoxin n=1 Tax=Bradyrhizobium guangdongense TaxID=1325090 RepID=A0A410V646_9BRAD|nr:4Fe-4S dicluster domain-containing protein [Bradyrhizobium guangdongense]QAU39097.1 4Fe-4S ferredoxin [Bradyrhizobium guangdongense]QOZ60155.1 4Fe-4S ferredoxin [Bradyrhizobium guangdongense]GGI26770.1 molybdopterin oxidoreductase [Bradyrhizobium guangdongense]